MRLTPREIEIVRCVCDGCGNRHISEKLSISGETVKRHLSNIFDKTGVSTRLELAVFALSKGIVSLDGNDRQPGSEVGLLRTIQREFLRMNTLINTAIGEASTE